MDKKISAMPSKATPIGADTITILDSADANPSTQNKKALMSSIPISTAVQTALDLKIDNNQSIVNALIFG